MLLRSEGRRFHSKPDALDKPNFLQVTHCKQNHCLLSVCDSARTVCIILSLWETLLHLRSVLIVAKPTFVFFFFFNIRQPAVSISCKGLLFKLFTTPLAIQIPSLCLNVHRAPYIPVAILSALVFILWARQLFIGGMTCEIQMTPVVSVSCVCVCARASTCWIHVPPFLNADFSQLDHLQ